MRKTVDRIESRLDLLEDSKKLEWEEREKILVELQELVGGIEDPELIPKEVLTKFRRPLESQVKDLRSAIVRETCSVITLCCEKLLKQFSTVMLGLLPTMLEMIATGNKVIASYVDQCCQQVFQLLRLGSILPRVLQLLNESKSRDVREACVRYLLLAFRHWGARTMGKHLHTIEDTLPVILRDASSTVRATARECFAEFNSMFPKEANSVFNRTDDRTQKALRKAVENHRLNVDSSSVLATRRRSHTTSSSSDSVSECKETDGEESVHSEKPTTKTVSRTPRTPRTRRLSACSQTSTISTVSRKSAPARSLAVEKDDAEPPALPTPVPTLPSTWVSAKNANKSSEVSIPNLFSAFQRDFESSSGCSVVSSEQCSLADLGPGSSMQTLEKLISIHRKHINDSLHQLAEELEILKQFESIAGERARTIEDPKITKQYSSVLAGHLARKQDTISLLLTKLEN